MVEYIQVYSEETGEPASQIAYNISEKIGSMPKPAKEVYDQLIVHELVENIERGLQLGLQTLKAGDIFVAGDVDEELSDVRETLYESLKSGSE